jgi:F420H(2)-dependent quinone reductase
MTTSPQTGQPQKKSTFSTTLQRSFTHLHIFAYQRTGGTIGGNLGGRPMLLLTTTGRKSGKAHITPISYFPDGECFIIIGSNWGAPKHPQWWLNLQTHPQTQIQVGRNTLTVVANEAVGEEQQRLWSLITTKYPNFLDYQKKTTRKIPVVILTPQ